MAKLIFVLIVVAALVIWLRRNLPRNTRTGTQSRGQQPGDAENQPPPAESMVPCALCGVYLPSSESTRGAGEKAYCCPAHRQQAEK